MALSSDELVKREIADYVGNGNSSTKLRVFSQGSREDQKLFSQGGLTFGVQGVAYGSCDAAWHARQPWTDPFDGSFHDIRPLVAVEGTDALNRGSSGNAQYQRFHHALGAVRAGAIGIYFFRPGVAQIQPDLYGMAYRASRIELGTYLVTDSLEVVRDVVNNLGNVSVLEEILRIQLNLMESKFQRKFQASYSGDWLRFAAARSTILLGDSVIKHAGRMERNFTDSSQRAGHIAVGEMYLTKYLFPEKPLIYLFPRMSKQNVNSLDRSKTSDKEWYLLRHEPGVRIATRDHLIGLPAETYEVLKSISELALKGQALQTYKKCVQSIVTKIECGEIEIQM